MKRSLYILLIFLAGFALQSFSPAAYKLLSTRTGHIWFHSKAPQETIEAHNYQVSSALNTTTGEMEFSALIKGFEFEKALMQEHFNENYLESDKYPTALFKGKISNIGKVNFKAKGTYPVSVEGELTIHGVTNHITINATLTVAEGAVLGKAAFPVRLQDYHVAIPRLVKEKIAEVVDVHVDMSYRDLQ